MLDSHYKAVMLCTNITMDPKMSVIMKFLFQYNSYPENLEGTLVIKGYMNIGAGPSIKYVTLQGGEGV